MFSNSLVFKCQPIDSQPAAHTHASLRGRKQKEQEIVALKLQKEQQSTSRTELLDSLERLGRYEEFLEGVVEVNAVQVLFERV